MDSDKAGDLKESHSGNSSKQGVGSGNLEDRTIKREGTFTLTGQYFYAGVLWDKQVCFSPDESSLKLLPGGEKEGIFNEVICFNDSADALQKFKIEPTLVDNDSVCRIIGNAKVRINDVTQYVFASPVSASLVEVLSADKGKKITDCPPV